MLLLLRKMPGPGCAGSVPCEEGNTFCRICWSFDRSSPGGLAPCKWAPIQAEIGCLHADVPQHCSAGPDGQGLTPVLKQPLHKCHQL